MDRARSAGVFRMSVIKTINARFSAAAPGYDISAAVQKSAAEKLAALIPALTPRHILDIGCGTGQLTCLLRRRWPVSEIVALDAATGMIEQARIRTAGDTQTKWLVADITKFTPATPFDLVAS